MAVEPRVDPRTGAARVLLEVMQRSRLGGFEGGTVERRVYRIQHVPGSDGLSRQAALTITITTSTKQSFLDRLARRLGVPEQWWPAPKTSRRVSFTGAGGDVPTDVEWENFQRDAAREVGRLYDMLGGPTTETDRGTDASSRGQNAADLIRALLSHGPAGERMIPAPILQPYKALQAKEAAATGADGSPAPHPSAYYSRRGHRQGSGGS